MANITFISHTDETFEVSADAGTSVMEAAVRAMVPGHEAECGGACACATCHVYVDMDWYEKTGDTTAMEQSMLDFANDPKETSRLSCQIIVSDKLDGLVVKLPASQG